jgi:cation diffusion facilitator CzcD-associated flavoprotein CzcO
VHQVIVVGAGPAGISAALSLRDRGVSALLVDRGDRVGSSWRDRYDRLRLNTGRQFSHLPGRPFPKGTPIYPTRDQFVAHLERHVRDGGIALRLGTAVQRIDRHGGSWRLITSTGDIDGVQIVVATGYQHTPNMPVWPGIEGFTGEVLHSSSYRNPAPLAGKRIVVVGAGSSGMEIAHDLATGGAAKVWLSIRTPPNLMPRKGPAGLPVDVIASPLYHAPVRFADALTRRARVASFGDLTEFGLPIPAEGVFSQARHGRAPTIVDLEVIDAVRDGSIEIVATVAAFDGATAALRDGRRIEPDAVICATGFLYGLEPLVGHLGVLDANGLPRAADEVAAAAGLRFIGFLSRPSLIGYVARKSRRVAKRIVEELSA